jgi:ribosomal protein S12 methylthiotransferase
MHYLYPYPHVDQIVPLMADGRILPYLDVPLQHGSPRILKAMRRPAAAEKVLERINRWREICPDLTIRSSFIVGFPGETERDFEELLEFVVAAQLDRVGCFSYSPVSGAEANRLTEPVPEELKEERRARLMAVQAEISRRRLGQKLGRRMTVLVDEAAAYRVIARGPGDAPEIDGNVVIEGAWSLGPGDFVDVEITGAGDHDLWGRPVQ